MLSVAGGLLWLMIFAPLPYPDPTPTQYASQLAHHRIGEALIFTGAGVVGLGLVSGLAGALLRT